MNSFDLSLAIPKKGEGDVMASAKYDTKVDPKSEKRVEQTVTEDGVNINKTEAPKLMLAGPLGYKYTQLLDTELSLESMAAVAAAAGATSGIEDTEVTPPGTPGFVAMGSTGPIIEDDTDAGYIYIVPADTLESRDYGKISQHFMDLRRVNAKRPLGLAMITDGKPTATMESLYKTVLMLGVDVCTSETGLRGMINSMKKGG